MVRRSSFAASPRVHESRVTIPPGAARILVVDDDPEIRRVLTFALTDEGYEVRSVPSGRAAIDLLEVWLPCVILLDLMMPDGDGWTFRDRQLAMPGAGLIPVIVLSAARNLRVERLKPAAVLPKPFNLDLLLDTIAGLVR